MRLHHSHSSGLAPALVHQCNPDSKSGGSHAACVRGFRRTKYIEANWKTKWVKPVLKKVKGLWESYREKAPALITSSVHERRSQKQELDAFDRIAQKLEKYTRPASEDEYQIKCQAVIDNCIDNYRLSPFDTDYVSIRYRPYRWPAWAHPRLTSSSGLKRRCSPSRSGRTEKLVWLMEVVRQQFCGDDGIAVKVL